MTIQSHETRCSGTVGPYSQTKACGVTSPHGSRLIDSRKAPFPGEGGCLLNESGQIRPRTTSSDTRMPPSLFYTSFDFSRAPGPKRFQHAAKSCIRCSPIQTV